MEKKRKIKLIVFGVIFILVFAFINIVIMPQKAFECKKYVQDLYSSCWISELHEHIDNYSLSLPLRLFIDEDDLEFSSDEELLEFSKKIRKMNKMGIGHKSIWSYSTREANQRRNELTDTITVDGVTYFIAFDITFAPRLFVSEPKIIDWEVHIREIKPAS